MRELAVREGQNIFDISVQEYGSEEGVFKLLEDNNDIDSLDHVFTFGDTVLIDDAAPKNKSIKDFYSGRELFATSGEEDINGDFNNDFNNDFDIV